MTGKYAMLHDIVGWSAVGEDAVNRYGIAIVTDIKIKSDPFQRIYMCRFWLPKTGRMANGSVAVSEEDMLRADLIGPMPMWAEWDIPK